MKQTQETAPISLLEELKQIQEAAMLEEDYGEFSDWVYRQLEDSDLKEKLGKMAMLTCDLGTPIVSQEDRTIIMCGDLVVGRLAAFSTLGDEAGNNNLCAYLQFATMFTRVNDNVLVRTMDDGLHVPVAGVNTWRELSGDEHI